MRYDVNTDGSLSNGHIFFDMTSAPGEDVIDGVKVDQRGKVYVSGPGGLWVISPAGRRQASRHDRYARASSQLCMGRRRSQLVRNASIDALSPSAERGGCGRRCT
jgi:gluconolactonase